MSAREDLGHATGHLLPAIAVMVAKVLRLKVKPSEEAKRIARLERQLERARASAKEDRRAAAKVGRLQAALDEARAELAEALARSAEVRASCGRSCPTCANRTPTAIWSTPGTRLRGTTLGEWVEAWRTLQARRVSSARQAALEAHLDALPDAVVEAAGPDELDAFEEVLRSAKPARGLREGRATTRLHDALDRRRRRLGLTATPRRDAADRVLDAAAAALRARPPAGVDAAYLDAFLHRHRDHLRGLVQGALASPPANP